MINVINIIEVGKFGKIKLNFDYHPFIKKSNRLCQIIIGF